MKKKWIIILSVALALVLSLTLFFTVEADYSNIEIDPLSYLNDLYDKQKTILPTAAQVARVKEGMDIRQLVQTVGKPQNMVSSGILILEFCMRDGRRMWVGYGNEVTDIIISDYPFQSYDSYNARHRDEQA